MYKIALFYFRFIRLVINNVSLQPKTTQALTIMEPSLLKNPFCNWGLFIHWSVFKFEIIINNNDSRDMMILSIFSAVKHQNE